MPRAHLAIAIALTALWAAPAAIAAETVAAAGDPFQAVLTRAVKKVEWQRFATKTWQRAAIDMLLLGGDTLRTGSESRAELLYGDGSVTRVGSLTSLTLTGDKRREIRLDAGKIWLNIRKSGAGMRIITPGAVAAVTGTELMVEFDALKRTTEVTVFEGAVNVTGDVGDLVRVLAGTTTRVPFKAPAMAPVPLDDRKLQERNRTFRPLSLDAPEPRASAGPDGQSGTQPVGVTPSAAPASPEAGRPGTGEQPAGPPTGAAASTAPTNPANDPAGRPTAPETAAPAAPTGGTTADKPVNPDLKGQNERLNDPRLINGSPTTGRVKVIIE